MIDYIKNLLPRLQQYSSSLDHKEIFIEQPWILIDENGLRHNYIFERNGNLILSINGKVTNGSWRYIAGSKALLIATSGEQFLLKHAFVDKGLMFLTLDGSPDKPWVFANENLIPDLDIQRYLLNVLIKKMQLERCTVNGKTAFVKEVDGSYIYYDEDVQPLNAEINHINGRNEIIRNGRIVRRFYTEIYSTDKGKVYVEQQYIAGVNVGDVVYINDTMAPDGFYQISKRITWIVSAGKIIEIKKKISLNAILIVGVLIVCVLVGIYFSTRIRPAATVTKKIPQTDSIIPPSFSVQDFKDEIIKRFNYVASKDFNSAADIYSDTINNYYGDRNVDKFFVSRKLYNYWQEHYRYIFLSLDTSSLSVVQNSGLTYITCNATDWYEDKVSKIPMIYELGYSFTLNKNMKIIEEHAKINSQVVDTLKLLHLPDSSSLDELRTNSNSEYLDAIFNDLNSDLLGPAYKEEIKWALVTTLGEDFVVYTQNNSNDIMNIRLFSNNLILKQMLFDKILNFITDASGRITGVLVTLSINPSMVADSTNTIEQ
jgi:hypothetical protein